MFSPDVIALKEFYSSTLGQAVVHNISGHLQKFWGNTTGNTVIGAGFALSYLEQMHNENNTVIALMPPAQGVVHWGNIKGNMSLLADEAELPFADNSVQRILLVHALENSEHPRHFMAEIWRVLAPTGSVIIIVPNRMGIWARSPKSPFAYGQPFSYWQLKQLFSEHSFTPLESESALFFPPGKNKYVLACANVIEKIGKKLFGGFGGVILISAQKQIYATHKRKIRFHALPSPKHALPQTAMQGIVTKD